jgi:glutamyl-tRNA synthetase
MLYRYFGWEDTMPEFAHLPLLLKPDGKGKLSKRDGDRLGFPVFPLEWKSPEGEISSGYREKGYIPEAVINMLALLGWHPSDNQELFSMDELVQAFDLERVSKSGAKFDVDKAKWFNHQYLMQASGPELLAMLDNELAPKHKVRGDGYIIKVLDLLKEKVNFASEILPLGDYFFGLPSTYDEKVQNKKWNAETAEHISAYITDLVTENKDTAEVMEGHLTSYAETNGISKGMLMQPLRWVISGQAGGPPIFEMLELIGLESMAKRLQVVQERFPMA